MTKMIFLISISFCILMAASGQSVAVSADGSAPHSSAMLDIKSNVKGLLLPRTSTISRTSIVGPAKGLILYDSTVGGFFFYNGSAWDQLGAGSSQWGVNGTVLYNTNTGFVGVGTNLPRTQLHINHPTQAYITYTNSTTGSDVGNGTFTGAINRDFYINNREFGNVIMYTNGQRRLVVDTIGRVGIGFPFGSFAEKLSINGGIGLYSGSTLEGSVYSTDTTLVLKPKQAPFCIPACPASSLILLPPADALGGNNGRVGVGTLAPMAKFHVTSNVLIGTGIPASGYLLSVNGKIMSEEVRVQLDADWPDYVFDQQYHLPTLAELEKYITHNKHLPNIPSAKEVEKEGIALGDMQKRLMEKVEELTLYVIQLGKENESLKRDIDALKKQKSQ